MTHEELIVGVCDANPSQRRAAVALAIREHFDACPAEVGTTELVNALLPVDVAERYRGGAAARAAIFKLLTRDPERNFPGYCHRGSARPGKGRSAGRIIRPWLWHRWSDLYVTPREEVEAPAIRLEDLVSALTERVAQLEDRVARLEDLVSPLNERIARLEYDLSRLRARVAYVEDHATDTAWSGMGEVISVRQNKLEDDHD